MATDLTKLVNLGTLQAYINKTISLVKDNFAKRNQAIKRVELVSEIVSPETEEKPYIKLYYIDDKDIDSATSLPVDHIEYIPITIDLGGSINEWVANKNYKVDEIVIYDNKIYKCITINNDATFDDTKWQMLGSDFKIDEYASGTDYKVNDIITYQQHLYKCKIYPQADNTTFNKAEWLLLGIDDSEQDLLNSLEIVELKEDTVDVNKVTGYKILFKSVNETDGSINIDSELAQTKDLPKLLIDDKLTKTSPNADKMTLSAKFILQAIETLSGTDLSMYATKDLIFEEIKTYTQVSDGSIDGAIEVTVDNLNEIQEQIPTISTGNFVTCAITYGLPLYLEKESSLYKDVLSQFTIETLKEDLTDTDLITGYIFKYRGKKIFTEDDKEVNLLDLDTFDLP